MVGGVALVARSPKSYRWGHGFADSSCLAGLRPAACWPRTRRMAPARIFDSLVKIGAGEGPQWSGRRAAFH